MGLTGDNTGALQEIALISIQPAGGSARQFAGFVEEFSFGGGEKSVEGIPMVAGNRIVKRSPMSDHEFTLKIYPTSTNTDEDLLQQFSLPKASQADAAVANTVYVGRGSENYQVCVLYTEDATATTANGTTVSGKLARRYILSAARITNYAPNFGDKILSAEVTFKAAAFAFNGTATLRYHSVKSGVAATLAAVPNYTGW